MDAEALIRIHLELECVKVEFIEDNYRLSRIECDNPDTLHRFYVAHHSGGYSRYYARHLPPVIFERLHELPAERAFTRSEEILKILAEDKACEEFFMGKSYVFPNTITAEDYPNVVMRDSVACILDEDRVISCCQSSRENATAAEAWVLTEPEYRGRGYARQVTYAWAHRVQMQGKLPFYSHLQSNLASKALAKSLGLIQYIADVGYA